MFVYSAIEGWTKVEALYFSIGTLLTIGYGDIAPKGDAAKAFTAVYIVAGTTLTAVGVGLINAYEIRLMTSVSTDEQRVQQRCLHAGTFHRCAWGLLVLMAALGTCYVHFAEGFSFIDSLYFVAVTLGHVGYGDLYVVRTQSHLFLIIFVSLAWFMTIFLLGRVTNIFIAPAVRAVREEAARANRANAGLRQKNAQLRILGRRYSKMLKIPKT
jgi:hypothetical protein